MPNPPPKEDTWAFQPIGSPFPEAPVKVLGEQNQYVALWYKHGKPIHGRSWNNGGVVECSFPYVPMKAELTGVKDLGGQIQILQYKGDHNSLGYWYEWIKYSERFDKADERQIVKCGDSIPILWKRKEGNLLGYLDNKTEKAAFSHDKTISTFEGGALSDMYIIVRNFKGGPPFCECASCPKPAPPPPPPPTPAPGPPPPPPPRVMDNEWMDARVGDAWPTRPLVKALDNPEQYVALWYMSGEPVMGRVWNEGGKIAACFSWFKREYKGNVGSIQLLVQLSEHVRGYDYSWVAFKEANQYNIENKTVYNIVNVDNSKVMVAPCILPYNGKQILGKCDVRNEKASAGVDGKELELVGPAVHPCLVLVRQAKKGYKFDV